MWVGNLWVNLSVTRFFWATTFATVCVASSGVCPRRSQFGFWAVAGLADLLSAADGSSLLAAVIRNTYKKKRKHVRNHFQTLVQQGTTDGFSHASESSNEHLILGERWGSYRRLYRETFLQPVRIRHNVLQKYRGENFALCTNMCVSMLESKIPHPQKKSRNINSQLNKLTKENVFLCFYCRLLLMSINQQSHWSVSCSQTFYKQNRIWWYWPFGFFRVSSCCLLLFLFVHFRLCKLQPLTLLMTDCDWCGLFILIICLNNKILSQAN